MADTRIAIIGSGPAGLTAAIYAGRANLKTVLIEGYQPGGQLTITTEVENFPGFDKGIMGPELMDTMRKQALRFGTEIIGGEVAKIDLTSSPKRITLDDGNSFTADAVIIATGATARLLGIPSEKHMMGFGVSACATCDGFFFTDKRIVVIGGGDSAMEEANFLSKFASKVVLIHRRDNFRASKVMIDRAMNNPKISVLWNKTIVEVLGDHKSGVTGLLLEDTQNGERSTHDTDGMFLAIGHTPNTKLFKGQLDTDKSGYLLVTPGTTKTNLPGVFAAGDVFDSHYQQAITAAGSGCMAALDAQHWLETI